jgi:hypothetical protein
MNSHRIQGISFYGRASVCEWLIFSRIFVPISSAPVALPRLTS